eukprot:6192221-Pleurochrysis_carterae.AAC.1
MELLFVPTADVVHPDIAPRLTDANFRIVEDFHERNMRSGPALGGLTTGGAAVAYIVGGAGGAGAAAAAGGGKASRGMADSATAAL